LVITLEGENMRSFIGVKPEGSYIPSKREALLFEKIAVIRYRPITFKDKLEASEFDWLLGKGVIFTHSSLIPPGVVSQDEVQAYYKLVREFYNSQDTTRKILNYQVSASYHRLLCLFLQEEYSIDAIPILPSPPPRSIPHEFPQVGKEKVLQVVFNKLPIPDDSVPWEDIIDFRNDPDTKSKFLGFRVWMSKLARENRPTVEIEEELEYLTEEYRNHIALHKLKYNTGALETTITIAAEVLEDLARLKFGKLAKSLFILKNRRIALMEAEHSAPGREIAYVVKASERLWGKA
jgi:hypothetical protein